MAADDKQYSIGIGTTGDCNLSCRHCYSLPYRGKTLTYAQVTAFIGSRQFSAINFGTGENILNPDFLRIVEYCHQRNIPMSYTSNGYGIVTMPDEHLRMFQDVDLSLDFPTQNDQNYFRGGTAWQTFNQAIERCQKNDIKLSIASTVMNCNYQLLPQLLAEAGKIGAFLRLNIFKRTQGTPDFTLSYSQFWYAVQSIFDSGICVACNEPILNALLSIPSPGTHTGCGTRSLRIHPDGTVVPCVYLSESDIALQDITSSFEPLEKSPVFSDMSVIPPFCQTHCGQAERCRGGCASRRFLSDGLSQPDTYCLIPRGKDIPHIPIRLNNETSDLVHASYLCTLIFKSR